MTETPAYDQPGFVAEEPEHCDACYRLIRSGQAYYLTISNGILCEDYIRVADAIRVSDDLTVVIEDERLLIRRGSAVVEVLPHEARHLVEAPVEGAAELADGQTRDE